MSNATISSEMYRKDKEDMQKLSNTYEELRKQALTNEDCKKQAIKLFKLLKELRERIQYVEECKFVTIDTFKDFLKDNGYILTAYYPGNINWDINHTIFRDLPSDKAWLDGCLIALGDSEKWDKTGILVNIADKPYVKYLSVGGKRFEISSVTYSGDAYETLLCPKLEKDLSKEWIKYLVSICPAYGDYLINEYKREKEKAQENLTHQLNLIEKELQRLKQKQSEEYFIKDNVIKGCDEMISLIQNINDNDSIEKD